MEEVKLTGFALVRPIKTSFRFKPKPKLPSLPSSHIETYKDKKTPTQCSDIKRRPKSSDSRDFKLPGAYQPSTNDFSGSLMQTLDRKISASSDQLDNLQKLKGCDKPRRARSGSRISYECKYQENEQLHSELLAYNDGQADQNNKIAGETFQKTGQRGSKQRGKERSKTPFEVFLEDDGPYSRRLYGPVTPSVNDKRQRSRERPQGSHSSQYGQKERELQNREKIIYTHKLCALTNYQGVSQQ